ncbi:MAG: hypothetical protein KAS32_17495, partial [Candidatus Peribacteraceae bacterium]|nr:hypothetical protein [Candidatus Peribacteraceae bacterium]
KSSKGGTFERDVCKFLSKWIQGTPKPYIFWRGRGSGGVFTQDITAGEDFAGDIYLVRPEGKFFTDVFSVEAKNGYPKASMDLHLKYNKSDPIRDFWKQCTTDATLTKRHPMLIYKKLGIKPTFVGIDGWTYTLLKGVLSGLRFTHLHYGDELPDLHLFSMDEFFNVVTPKVVERIEIMGV